MVLCHKTTKEVWHMARKHSFNAFAYNPWYMYKGFHCHTRKEA